MSKGSGMTSSVKKNNSPVKVRYSDQPAFKRGLSIFLAGPTRRVKPGKVVRSKSWRLEAIKILQKLQFEGTVLVPERQDWSVKFDYTDQTEWEFAGLKAATVIVFWVPRTARAMPALTTNVEFGFWIAKKPDQIIYGRPPKAPSNRYLDWMHGKLTQRAHYGSLEETLRAALEHIDQRAAKKRNR
jgi:hypothetical protein